jgi:hypothetical protein
MRRAGRLYPLSTLSSDGRKLVVSTVLGDGTLQPVAFGLIRFNLESADATMFWSGATFPNPHMQYCRSLDVEASRDLLLQEDHGAVTDKGGFITAGLTADPRGSDIHLIRDDGTALRDLPWGRSKAEIIQVHQCWLGRSTMAITSNRTNQWQRQLIAGVPVPHAGHRGVDTPGGVRNDLTREFPGRPNFYHFQTDMLGRRIIADYLHPNGGWQIYLGELPARPLSDPLSCIRLLLTLGPFKSDANHPHPFLSPDGKVGFFNAEIEGVVQAFAVLLS